jgi:inosine/xanthosine triphosphatase
MLQGNIAKIVFEMKKVIVGSHNPVKLQAVETAFAKMFPEETFTFVCHEAPSGVADQPNGDTETRSGAYNRALACRDTYPDSDFFVGLEGGSESRDNELWVMAWMCIIDKERKCSYAKSASFLLPHALVQLINEGMELGHAADRIFQLQNSKQKTSTVGFLTGDVVTRARFYTEALILALIPFKNPELYKELTLH